MPVLSPSPLVLLLGDLDQTQRPWYLTFGLFSRPVCLTLPQLLLSFSGKITRLSAAFKLTCIARYVHGMVCAADVTSFILS